MPGPDPHALWIDDHGPSNVRVSWQAYFWTGNNGNRKKRAESILRRLALGTWQCRWCDEALPDYVRADAIYCCEGCRKRAARGRRRARLKAKRNVCLQYADVFELND